MAASRTRPVILSGSRVSRALRREARRYAAVDATVLLTGETGVGKDALARYLHLSGPRSREPFVTVDCPALSATLVEVELFGHERGAFTDASIARGGRFERAGHGTIYLDAVTALGRSAQGALLRVIEERTVTRLGGSTEIAVAARIIASPISSIGCEYSQSTFCRCASAALKSCRSPAGSSAPSAAHRGGRW
jgi:DNA-binding NtrC family response regulator